MGSADEFDLGPFTPWLGGALLIGGITRAIFDLNEGHVLNVGADLVFAALGGLLVWLGTNKSD
ncbi:MAG: hypothetical protein AAB955_01660 [Patescibacteria group bacterium]